MPSFTTVNGPFLKQRSINSAPVDSSTRSYVLQRTKLTVARKKPLAGFMPLISNMTNYSSYQEEWHRQMLYTKVVNPVSGDQITYVPGVGASSRSLHNSLVIASEKVAIERLLAKVKGEVWNLSTFMGELPETLGWFKQTAKALVDSYIAVRRGRIKDVARIVKRVRRRTNRQPLNELHRVTDKVSSKWLEWRYAVSPLVYDMEDALSYLYDARVKNYVRRESGGHSDSHMVLFRPSGGSNGVWEARWQCRATLYYRVNANAEAFKKLGLLNPLATLWELTPLSFVVDWFLPIGTYIANLDAMAGVTVLARSSSKRETETDTQSGIPGSLQWTDGPSTYKAERYSRSLSLSLVPPLPRFGLSLSGKQTLDSLALFRQIALKG